MLEFLHSCTQETGAIPELEPFQHNNQPYTLDTNHEGEADNFSTPPQNQATDFGFTLKSLGVMMKDAKTQQ